MRKILLLGLSLLTLMVEAQTSTCPQKQLQAVRLPDLQLPRANHNVFFLNGEIFVAGGHTTGFVTTPTLEYYSGGEWHLDELSYSHDMGAGLVLDSSRIFLAGGTSDAFGIGQTFFVEFYDAIHHTVVDYGCLDTKRCMPSALEVDSGRIVISGNWYHKDDIELYDKTHGFTHVRPSVVNRSFPYIMRTAADSVVVFGALDSWGKPIAEPDLVDFVPGDTVRIPFLSEWHPLPLWVGANLSDCFIGDVAKGDFSYLMPVVNSAGEVAVCQVRNGVFSLLPTDYPIPTYGRFGKLDYFTGSFLVDRRIGHAYLLARDYKAAQGYYVVDLDYNKADSAHAARVSLYYTQTLSPVEASMPVLTDDGNIVLAGGSTDSNYKPHGAVYLLMLHPEDALLQGLKDTPLGLFVAAALLLVGVVALFYLLYRRRKAESQVRRESSSASKSAKAPHPSQPSAPQDQPQLMEQIRHLMEEKEVYLQPNLKLSDVAEMLQTTTLAVSRNINVTEGCSYSAYVNRYRISCAKRLIQKYPNKKISDIGLLSGFSNDATFFRTFKEFVGCTPLEYRNKAD